MPSVTTKFLRYARVKKPVNSLLKEERKKYYDFNFNKILTNFDGHVYVLPLVMINM